MKKELLSLKYAPKAQCCHREISASVSPILLIRLLRDPQTIKRADEERTDPKV